MCDKNTLVFGVEEDKCKVSIEFGHDPIGWDGASVTKGHVGMNDQRNLGSIGLGDAIILSKGNQVVEPALEEAENSIQGCKGSTVSHHNEIFMSI